MEMFADNANRTAKKVVTPWKCIKVFLWNIFWVWRWVTLNSYSQELIVNFEHCSYNKIYHLGQNPIF